MTSATIIVHPAARAEFDAVRAWYTDRNPRVAVAFVDQIAEAFELLGRAPRRYPLWTGRAARSQVRRYLVRGFPYVNPYIVEEEAVFVLAIAHSSRRPGYWASRLGP